MAERDVDLKMVLLGKTGAGKSSSGNTILGRHAFVSWKSSRSVTRDVAVESGTVCGILITVYDTPGLCDTELSDDEIQLKYQSLFQRCESGLCVFLLVIKADRFTQEERETVERIEELLGEKRLKKTWILFTRGDELEEEKVTIQEFINFNQQLKKLVQKYEGRYHVFNNKTKAHIAQVQMLLEKIFIVKGAPKLEQSSLKSLKPKATPSVTLSFRQIVLLGKTGVGKSAAGNTILGRKEFKSMMRMNAVTSECSLAYVTVSGRSVFVVDTPGLIDTQMNPEQLLTEIGRSVYLSYPGPHAFLIVLRANDRYTEQEQQIPQMIEMMFGQEVFKYSIILFTHGDDLEGEPIEKDIEESSALRRLVQQCGGRFHVFNNKDQRNREQVNDLLQKIDTMIEQNGGGHYSDQMYEDALRFRRREERKRREEERRRREEKIRQIEEERRKLKEEIDRIERERRERNAQRQTCVCS